MSKTLSKIAILQVADTGPLESLVQMLGTVGYQSHIPSPLLNHKLKQAFNGKGLVLEIDSLIRGMGYERPIPLPLATPEMMSRADLYVDVKAHQIYPEVISAWPNLRGKVLWYRINGAKPEHVVNARGDHGNEVNPPCPVLTPNQWYRNTQMLKEFTSGLAEYWDGPQSPSTYVCWPPFYRFNEYYDHHGRETRRGEYINPICLIHNVRGWGYGALLDSMSKMGVAIHGQGSPDGLLNHREIPGVLSRTLAMVHLKSNDAPGYALYEALAAGCPIICTRRIIWRCRMQDLLIPGETCLVFDRETHEGLSQEDVEECTREVGEHLRRLEDPSENSRIGMAGYRRLKEIMWSPTRENDVQSLGEFFRRNYP